MVYSSSYIKILSFMVAYAFDDATHSFAKSKTLRRLIVNQIRVRSVLCPLVVTLMLATPWLVNCGAINSGLSKAGVPGASCPDLNVDAIIDYDFVKEFSISAEAGAKLKAGAAAAVELKDFAAKIDLDLKNACGAIAKDLGQTGEPKDGTEACRFAIKAIHNTKGKIGANGKVDVMIKPPVCRASMNVMADCAAKCDAKVSGGSAKVECEPGKLSGECGGKCDGSCEMKTAARCEGECNGSCDAEIKGSCSGTCNGKCDGKASKDVACAGTCEGKCEGGSIKGQCRGKCGGSCEIKTSASCEGTCTGKCSVEFKKPSCTGEVKPPEMSAECKGHCDAQVQSKAECSPAEVAIVVVGAADAKAASQLKATLEKNLPAVLKIAIGLGRRAEKMSANVKAIVEGVKGSLTGMAQSGGSAASSAAITSHLTACFGSAFQGAIGAAGSLKANVDVSVNVKASATASASGSAATK